LRDRGSVLQKFRGVARGQAAETPQLWTKKAERDGADGGRAGDVEARPKALECESRDLGQTNEIPRKASAYRAPAELDRRQKP